MLLHSREGSGEHRLVDANALVEESLNLAYHGARAEKPGFKINMERSFDPAAGQVDVFPQEITRALLNLISNGFYAATKRRVQTNSDTYEPTLMAATKTSAKKLRLGFAITAPAFRMRSGKRCSILLHNETRGRRHWPWPVHHSRHHRQATFGLYRGRDAARGVHRNQDYSSARSHLPR
jgi:hypothetical protein